MALFAELMTALSADVVAALAAGGYPSLVDGAILFGPAHVFEHSRPPRVVVSPMGSKFGAPDLYPRTATERKKMVVLPVAHSETVTLEVRCWGIASPRTDAGDYDMTRTLAHAVLASLQRIVPNHGLSTQGEWTKSGPIDSAGREFVFAVSIDTPVLDSLLPYNAATMYASAGTTAVTTDTYTNPDGTTGTGC